MKRIILALFIFIIFRNMYSETLLDTFYTVGKDNVIHYTDKSYLSDPGSYEGVTPYVFKSRVAYRSQNNSYALEFFNYRGWEESEPGFARVCDLYCNGKKMLRFIDEMGWSNRTIPLINRDATVRTDECLIFCQKNNVDVIIFQGHPYESQPRIVVIAVQGSQAKVVSFTDQKFHIESVSKDPDGYFEIRLEDDWWEEGPDGYNHPKSYTMKATAGGMYLYKD